MGAIQIAAVLAGVGGSSIVPAFITKDPKWGLVVLFGLLFLLAFWAAYRLYCESLPKFDLVTASDVRSLSSYDSEAVAFLHVKNLSSTRLRNVRGTLRQVKGLYGKGDTPESDAAIDLLEQGLWPQNFNHHWVLRWRLSDSAEINIDESAILEIAGVRTNQDIGDAKVFPVNSTPSPQFFVMQDQLIEIEVASENAGRIVRTFRLHLDKSNPPRIALTLE